MCHASNRLEVFHHLQFHLQFEILKLSSKSVTTPTPCTKAEKNLAYVYQQWSVVDRCNRPENCIYSTEQSLLENYVSLGKINSKSTRHFQTSYNFIYALEWASTISSRKQYSNTIFTVVLSTFKKKVSDFYSHRTSSPVKKTILPVAGEAAVSKSNVQQKYERQIYSNFTRKFCIDFTV